MIAPFESYLASGKVVKQHPSLALSHSLLQRATRRYKKVLKEGIDTTNPDFTYETLYEALREAIQSLMAIHGYKPYSHEATIAFLNEFYNLSDYEIHTLDIMRETRNQIMYYGKNIDSHQIETAYAFFKKQFPKIVSLQNKDQTIPHTKSTP